MEADWEVEIGNQAPVIDAFWPGLIDLRRAPEMAAQLPESRQLPALAEVLVQLNRAGSPVWTSKCDVWAPAEFDPDELDAQAEEGKCAMACYIDMLSARDSLWPVHDAAVAACQEFCARLREAPLRCCRADLIVRRAYVTPDRQDLAMTVYLTACGSTLDRAGAMLESALRILVDSVLRV